MRGSGLRRQWRGGGSSCNSGRQDTRTAPFLDPLAYLWPIEIIQVALASAASRVHGGDGPQSRLDVLFAQQLAECIENDSIADAEEQMKRSRHDAFGRDSEEGTLVWMEGVTVSRCAIARGVEVVVVRDDADRTAVRSRRSHIRVIRVI